MSSSDKQKPEPGGTGSASARGAGSMAGKPADARADRLAAALRQNLQRRKAQARGRKAHSGPEGGDAKQQDR